MFEEIKNIKSGSKELRQFGITIGVVTGLLGVWCILAGKGGWFYFVIISALFLSLGMLRPLVLKPIQKVWMTLARLIGWLVTRLILTIFFYCVVTPIGIVARLFGKRFLDTKCDIRAASYWIPKESAPSDKKAYENQF